MFPLLDQLFSNPVEFLQDMLYRIPALLIALTLHEWAHGFVAYKLGDPTAKYMGRLTVNPLKHLDPVGAFMLFFLGFGYAKPVPVNPNNFRKKHRDDFLVSIAGITMNLLLYLLFIIICFGLGLRLYSDKWYIVKNTLLGFIDIEIRQALLPVILGIATVNLSLAVFNLLPVPPLDGFHLLNDLIIKGNLFVKQQMAQMGMGILLLLSFTGWLGKVLGIVVEAIQNATFWLLHTIFGV